MSEEDYLRYREELSELLRYSQAGRSVSAVTHDVNNFLGAILAYTELIASDSGLSDDSRRMSKEISRIVKKCTALVDTHVTVSRQKSKGVSICDIKSLSERVLNLCTYEMKMGQIKWEISVDSNIASFALDEGKVTRALLYMLVNAVEHLRDEPLKHIQVCISETSAGVDIAVKNSGVPIPESEQTRVFEGGYTTKDGGRLGLGLTVAREAARFHQGDLVYDTDRGFVLQLPRENGLQA